MPNPSQPFEFGTFRGGDRMTGTLTTNFRKSEIIQREGFNPSGVLPNPERDRDRAGMGEFVRCDRAMVRKT